MKKSSPWFLCALLALAWAGCQTPPAPHGNVTVNYDHPEKFADFKSEFNGPTSQAYLDDFRHYLETWAGRQLPVGQTLTLTFTDIDMAGDMNPVQTELRVERPIYPVRLTFTWEITDARGAVVRQGAEKLVNDFPQSQTGFDRRDPLFHEKSEMDDWIHQTLH